MGKVYVLIHDKDKSQPPKTFYSEDKIMFAELNARGWGVYQAVNDFEATEKQMADVGVKTKRNIRFLEKINAVFADLDIAKAGDGQARQEKEARKEALLFELYDKLPPSYVIDTSNGVQPIWVLSESDTSPEFQRRYVALINGIIRWSKTAGAAGDEVKDVTRVLRCPGYQHMKEEPYMVTKKYEDDLVYTLDDLEAKFKYFIIKPEKEPEVRKINPDYKLNPVSQEIDRLDFQELMKRAFASIGRPAEFDRTGRLILDGRLTGTFQGRNGDRAYLASSSHEPYKGNRITAVADILGITNKEARAWVVAEYKLDDGHVQARAKVEELAKPVQIKPMSKFYSWGTKGLTESFAPIKRTTYSIVGGGYGVGKTSYCINLALENVKLGHRVLYLSLEMDTEEIIDFLSRKFAGITIKEEIYNEIPKWKSELYNKKRHELALLENFTLKGVRGGTDIDWPCVVELMAGDWDLIILDNFNLVQKEKGMNQFEHEGQLSTKLTAYVAQKQTPLIVVHHYSKGGAREEQKTGYSLGGNSKIMNDAQRIILLDRKKFDEDEKATEEERAAMRITIDKGRAYDQGFTKTIYFYKGSFVDNYPKQPPTMWQDKI